MPVWSDPHWLWFLLLVPVYFFLHLLLRTVQNQPFSSLRIWKRVRNVINRKSQNAPSFKNVITALLLSLLLSGLIISLAGPTTTYKTGLNNLHLLIDMSASMQVQNREGVSRYQQAIRKLKKIAGRTSPSSSWTVTLLTKPVTTKEGSPTEIISFLRGQSPTDLSFQRSLSKLVDKQVGQRNRVTYLITDSPPPSSSRKSDRFKRLLVGSPRKNTGIVFLSGRRIGSSLELSIQLAYHGPGNQSVQIEVIDQKGNIHSESTHTINAGSPTTHFLQLDEWNSVTGRVRMKPTPPDAFPRDNVTHFALTSPYRVRTKTIGKKNQHLSKLLSALSMVQPVADGSDVVFAYRPDPEQTRTIWNLSNQKRIVVNPELPPDLPFETNQIDQILSPESQPHPLVQNISMKGMTIRNAQTVKTRSPSRSIVPLVTHQDQPLVFLRQGDASQVWMLFDPFVNQGEPLRSNWAIHPELYPGFVQFWQNVFDQFQPLNVPYHGDIVYWQTGEKIGTRATAPSDGGKSHPTNKVGLKEVRTNGSTTPLPVNLTSRSETNTILAQTSSDWSSIQNEMEEVTERKHTDTLTRALLFFFLFTLVIISLLHRASRSGTFI